MNPTNDWQLSLSTPGEIVQGADDLAQCVAVILKTQKGSSPLRPNFGVDIYKYIDLPVSEAGPLLRKELLDALTLWEPRITVRTITFQASAEGKLTFKITWSSPYGGGLNQVTY